MILGALGLFLNIFTIVILSIFFSVIMASLIVVYGARLLPNYEAVSRSQMLWSAVLLPWIVSVIAAVILLFPELLEWQAAWLPSSLHWHHIYSFPVMSWHGAALLVFTALCTILMAKKLVTAVRVAKSIDQLNDFLNPEVSVSGCRVIDSPSVNAFTTWFLRPKAYLTSGLLKRLTKEEAQIVEHHELAHANSFHPLKKYVFSLLASFFPSRIERTLNEFYSVAIEQSADHQALVGCGDATTVSTTIVKVARLQSCRVVGRQLPLGAVGFSAHPLELRVRYLLNDDKGNAFPFLVVFLSSFSIAAISTISVDFLHHSFELLFSH